MEASKNLLCDVRYQWVAVAESSFLEVLPWLNPGDAS